MTAVDMYTSMFRLGEDGAVLAQERRTTPDLEGWTMMTLHVERDEDAHPEVWEQHTQGDEVTCVLSGGVRVYLRDEADPRDPEGELVAHLGPGSAYVVPRGRWHRLELDGPSDIMAFTRVSGTQLERRTGW
ncbi:cupin domain-containing protein [Streptomyces iconiensis]|uniref:Cupin domain-containing protein n=1 Tax=Streptomyces iconiensis TaxID=1384038 RepID=A0ABT6ZNH0_9ACTN|nr:cupin domain-containing protein [Streptomyces iconiensis]MDJ1130607.1 cupin domain-containing protein [Streptomyces iconiensis]